MIFTQITQEFQSLSSEGGWVFWCLLALAFGISFAVISIWSLLRLPSAPIIKGEQWKDLLLQNSGSSDLFNRLTKKITGVYWEFFNTCVRKINQKRF